MNDTTAPLAPVPPENSDARIGRMVEVLLDLLGLSKQELAARVGLSPSGLGQRISGARSWRSREVEQVAAALGFPVSTMYADPASLVDVLRDGGGTINYRSA